MTAKCKCKYINSNKKSNNNQRANTFVQLCSSNRPGGGGGIKHVSGVCQEAAGGPSEAPDRVRGGPAER